MKYKYVNIALSVILLVLVLLFFFGKTQDSVTISILSANEKINNLLYKNSVNFVITGDPKYKENYSEILNVVNGHESWDLFLHHPFFKNKKGTFEEIYKELGIPEKYTEHTKESQKHSLEIAWEEITAMNWRDGYINTTETAKQDFFNMKNKELITFDKKITDPKEQQVLKQNAIKLIFSNEIIEKQERVNVLTNKSINIAVVEETKITNLYTYGIGTFIFIQLIFNTYLTFQKDQDYFKYINMAFVIVLFMLWFMYFYIDTNDFIILDVIYANRLLSSFLTFYSRNYILTGNEDYKNKYFEILNIRVGDESWDKYLSSPFFKDRTNTVEELFDLLNLEESDLAFVRKSLLIDNEITWQEITAMNWINGYIDPNGDALATFNEMNNKSFIEFPEEVTDEEELKQLKKEAVEVLFSVEYITLTEQVRVLSEKSSELILARENNSHITYGMSMAVLISIQMILNIYLTMKTNHEQVETEIH